jgi:hypothetical protein
MMKFKEFSNRKGKQAIIETTTLPYKVLLVDMLSRFGPLAIATSSYSN